MKKSKKKKSKKHKSSKKKRSLKFSGAENRPGEKAGLEAFLEYYRQFFTSETEFNQFLKSLKNPNSPILRFHPKHEGKLRKLWEAESLPWKTLSWYKNALLWPENIPPKTILPGYKERYFYAMNASSLLPVLALNPQAGDLILDACAAPGGKALFIDDLLDGKGLLITNDLSSFRRGRMRQIFKAYNKPNMEVWGQRAQTIYHKYPNYFDKILLDSPCSSEKHVYNSQKELDKWSVGRVKRLAKRQENLLMYSWKALKAGGRFVYSTCAVTPEENEAVVKWFLDNHQDAKLVSGGLESLSLEIDDKKINLGEENLEKELESLKTTRILPQVNGLNPMFIAVFEKTKLS